MTSSAAAGPRLRSPRLTLAAMCLAQAMILLDNTIVNVALPSIQHELDVVPGNLEWIVNAYVLALAALILVGGTLGDRYGRRRCIVAGLTLFTLLSAACALASSAHQLIAFRAVQGVGAALVTPLTLSILAAAYPPERRASAFGIWAAAAGLGFGAGPVVGGILLQAFGWSAVFWVNVPLGAIAVVLVLVGVSESRDPTPRRVDLAGTVLVTVGLFALTFGVIETDEAGWLSLQTGLILGVAVAALVGFVWWEGRTPHPMVPLALFRDARFSAATGVYAIMYLALTGVFFFVTLLFQDVKGWSPLRLGLSWLAMNVPFLPVSVLAGRLTRRFGSTPCWVGVGLAALGILSFARLDAGSSFWDAVPGYVLIGLGYGSAVPALSATAMQSVPVERAGVGAGVLNTARQAGSSVGLALLGSISLATITQAWRDRIPQLPASARGIADQLVPQVAGGQVRDVAAELSTRTGLDLRDRATGLASASFVPGMQLAMLVAGVLMVVAAGLTYRFVRERPVRAATAPAENDLTAHHA